MYVMIVTITLCCFYQYTNSSTSAKHNNSFTIFAEFLPFPLMFLNMWKLKMHINMWVETDFLIQRLLSILMVNLPPLSMLKYICATCENTKFNRHSNTNSGGRGFVNSQLRSGGKDQFHTFSEIMLSYGISYLKLSVCVCVCFSLPLRWWVRFTLTHTHIYKHTTLYLRIVPHQTTFT